MTVGIVLAGGQPIGNLSHYRTVPILQVTLVLTIGLPFLAVALSRPAIPVAVFWFFAVVWRGLLMLTMAPGADIYRYIWEGSVQLAGFNPYALAPNSPELATLHGPVWDLVEHKAITAIYPPLTQLGFAGLAALSPSVWLFKTAFVAADLALCRLLARRFSCRDAVLYAWNPVVLVAIAGFGHYDSWLALPLAAGWLVWTAGPCEMPEPRRAYAACLLLGMAVAIKWIALPVAAWCVWRLLRERGIGPAMVGAACAAAPFLLAWPLATHGQLGTLLVPTDYALYARSAECLPAAVETLWPGSRYHNEIFAIPVLLGAVLLILFQRNLLNFNELWFFLLLIFSPVFHLWYLVWLIPFAVASRNLGTLLVSVSGFAYLGLYALPPDTPGEFWRLSTWELLTLWSPLVLGFAWTYRRTIGPRKTRATT